jgi:uncharacterized protein
VDKRAVRKLLTRFRKALETRGIPVQRMILYGSCAHGTNRDGSDIDVVVLSDGFRGRGYWERIEILADAIYELFEPIEAVAMTPEEWERGESFVAHCARDGEVVYRSF